MFFSTPVDVALVDPSAQFAAKSDAPMHDAALVEDVSVDQAMTLLKK